MGKSAGLLLLLSQTSWAFVPSRPKLNELKVPLHNNFGATSSFVPQKSSLCAIPTIVPSDASFPLGDSILVSFDPSIDVSAVVGSFLWGLNLYLGFDWLLAPLNLDNDFNPSARTTVAIGRILAGRGIEAAAKPIIDTDGERPELGTRIGTGANLAYSVEVDDDGNKKSDWLSDREAGFDSKAPILLSVTVAFIYLLFGVAFQTIIGSENSDNSALTAGVFTLLALVYELGRPALPTREEALFDDKLDEAVASFVEKKVLRAGEKVGDGAAPVREDESVNEYELVTAFRKEMGYDASEVADTQIEMRMRSYGTGRSAAGFIKGIRLLK